MTESKRTGAEELRLIVSNLNACREGFLDPFTAEDLIKIGRAHLASEWDFYPDQWTSRQVREALAGIPPTWNKDERPTYTKRTLAPKVYKVKLWTGPPLPGSTGPVLPRGDR